MKEKYIYIEEQAIITNNFYSWKEKVRMNGEESREIENIVNDYEKLFGELFNKLYN